jgi:hypothetical protein
MTRSAKKPKIPSDSVTRSEPFAAMIRKADDGKNTLVVQGKMYYQHQLNKFKEGTRVTLEVHTRKPKRTEQQNRYYWGVYLPLIANETGEKDLDALHELFKGKFLAEGIVEVLGEKVRKKKSTTELSTSEFCSYIMDIEALTLVAAPPTENFDLAPLHGTRLEQREEDEQGIQTDMPSSPTREESNESNTEKDERQTEGSKKELQPGSTRKNRRGASRAQ